MLFYFKQADVCQFNTFFLHV